MTMTAMHMFSAIDQNNNGFFRKDDWVAFNRVCIAQIPNQTFDQAKLEEKFD